MTASGFDLGAPVDLAFRTKQLTKMAQLSMHVANRKNQRNYSQNQAPPECGKTTSLEWLESGAGSLLQHSKTANPWRPKPWQHNTFHLPAKSEGWDLPGTQQKVPVVNPLELPTWQKVACPRRNLWLETRGGVKRRTCTRRPLVKVGSVDTAIWCGQRKHRLGHLA